VSFFNELKRRNVFRVAITYLAAAWLLTEVADTLFGAFGIPDWATRFIIIVLALGFLPALVFSWVYELTPEGLKREKDVVRDESITHKTTKRLDILTIGMIVFALGFIVMDRFWLGPELANRPEFTSEPEISPLQEPDSAVRYPPNSIAVLPFVNMSSDVEQEYFSDGISEELLNLLARLPELQVIARTSSFAFKGKDVTIAEIARELNVAYVLEGSVRRSSNQVRITAQLIRSMDSSHLWSATFDRAFDNIFAIQDEIAAAVVRELQVTLLGEEVPTATTTNPEAYALYLQGRHLSEQNTAQAFEASERLLKQAVTIDPDFAPAWRQLGAVYRDQEDFGRPRDEALKLAQESFERSLALDPYFAPAYASMSLLARQKFEFSLADDYLRKALQLAGDSGFPYGVAASLSRTFGRFEESIDFADRSIALNPVSASAYSNLGYSCYYALRLDDAASAFRRAISLNPAQFRSYVYLGRVLIAQGALQDALEVIERTPHRPYRLAGLALAHHALGDTDASSEALSDLTEGWGEFAAFQIAEIHAFRGDHDAAFEWLEKALHGRDSGLAVLLGDPVFDELTSDRRYRALVEKLGLTVYWEEMKLRES
jgi:adenylate cyclase